LCVLDGAWRAAYAALDTPTRRFTMTLCPIAIAAGCKKCPVFSVCPLKGVIGDQQKVEPPPPADTKGKAKKP
jgi:hypothetical protein